MITEIKKDSDSKQKDNTRNFTKLSYANDFGRFQKVGEIRDLIPRFKDYYYKVKLENEAKYSAMKIIVEFQEIVKPLIFCPYPNQFMSWRKKWDKDIMGQLGYIIEEKKKSNKIKTAIKMNNDIGISIIPSDDDLEGGVKTLAGSLINDASTMLEEDIDNSDLMTSDELIKRRSYIVNVMAHVTKLVHGKEALKLKSNANQRENAGFLINLLNQASSGKITPKTIEALKSSITTNTQIEEDVKS